MQKGIILFSGGRDLSKILKDAKTTGTCHSQCVDISKRIPEGANVKKAINVHNPWGENPVFKVRHLTGDYTCHFVVQVGEVILDPFLREGGPIPAEEYLGRAYKNPEEIRLVNC